MYSCATRWYTVVDEMFLDEMSVDELSWKLVKMVARAQRVNCIG